MLIEIEPHKFYVDTTHKIILCQQDLSLLKLIPDHSFVELHTDTLVFTFTTRPATLSYSNYYEVEHGAITYKLFFTLFPIISISAGETITDDPKVPVLFSYVDTSVYITSIAGIEIRGAHSQTYPKKTYDLEFSIDSQGLISRNFSFGSLRSDDDWVLDALYNEPIRIRSHIAHKLWLKIHTLSYQENEPEAKSGADVMYVELFINNEYQGIYALSEQVDNKLLHIKKRIPAFIRGELYKGSDWGDAVMFEEADSYNNSSPVWSGHEYKFPEDIIDWSNLYDFTDFVVNSSDEQFTNNIGAKFDIANAIDYFIFLNILRATDNTGKNIYIARYQNGTPYFYTPWDLDGVFGIIWDGSRFNYTSDILSNGLLDRLLQCNPDNFRNRLSIRWNSLRQNTLHRDSLFAAYDAAYYHLKNAHIFEREKLIWNQPHHPSELAYIKNWTSSRLIFLDQYFNTLISRTESTTNTENLLLYTYPSPVKAYLTIEVKTNLINTFEIRNNQGVIVMEGTLSIGSNTLDTRHLADGLYSLIAGNHCQKIIVIKD